MKKNSKYLQTIIDYKVSNEQTLDKYKFQEMYYSLNELALVFLQQDNFELALIKHLSSGNLEKYLQKLNKYDLFKAMKAQEKPLNKLIVFVYSLNSNLDFILYGKVIDKEYIFQLFLKQITNNLNKIERKIYRRIILIKNFQYNIELYEKLTNKKTGIIKFLSKINFSNLKKSLDIENILFSNDDELIDLSLKYTNKNSDKIIEILLKIKNKELFNKIYKKLLKYNYEINEIELNEKILQKAIEKETIEVVEFLLSKNFLTKEKKAPLISLLYNHNLLDKYLSMFDFEFLENEYFLERTLEIYDDTIKFVSISSDNKHIISGNSNGIIKLWDLQTGEYLKTLGQHNDSIQSLAISSDNKYIVSVDSNDTIKLWDLQTGEYLKTYNYNNNMYLFASIIGTIPLDSFKECFTSLAISSDNKHIISGNSNGIIKLWDLQTGEYLKTLGQHNDSIQSLAISSDNKYIVFKSIDKTIRIWDFFWKSYLENKLDLLKFDVALKLIKKNLVDLKIETFVEKDCTFLRNILKKLPEKENLLVELLNKCIKINDFENINILIQELSEKGYQKELKDILKKEKENKQVVEIFKKNQIKISFFERFS